MELKVTFRLLVDTDSLQCSMTSSIALQKNEWTDVWHFDLILENDESNAKARKI
ncbi:hypothetical protein ACT7C1_22765 [Bacillus paranthracis]